MKNRVATFVGLLAASWCVMTLSHETGHILGGWCSGGVLVAADLWPWHLPYSLFNPNPHPLITLWCGPLLGVALPVFVAFLVKKDWGWFVANFCVVANGTYLAVAWWAGDSQLDTAKLLSNGCHPFPIAAYCLITIVTGYIGFRKSCRKVLSSDV